MSDESATRKGAPDLASIKRDYQAGQISLRALGSIHGISESYIRKLAKKHNWPPRDLVTQVREKAATELVRATVADARGYMPNDEDEVVDAAAAVVIELVRQHRVSIKCGRQIVEQLFGQLQEAIEFRGEIEAEIEAECAPMIGSDDAGVRASGYAKQARMLRAVSLPAHAGVIKDLAMALKHLIPLERKAFNLDVHGDGDNRNPPDDGGRKHDDERLTRLRDRLADVRKLVTIDA